MWNDLSISEKNSLIQLYIQNGVTSLDKMKKHYNSFATGGSLDEPPFVKRYSEGQERAISTPQGNATHKLSYAEADGKYIVYPNVQPIDYNNPNSPLYDYEDNDWTAYDRAVRHNDTLQFNTAREAEYYTKNYKRAPFTGAMLNNSPKIALDFSKGRYYDRGGHLYYNGGPNDERPYIPNSEQNYGYLKPVEIVGKHPYRDTVYGNNKDVPEELKTYEGWQRYKNHVDKIRERPDYEGINPMNIVEYMPLVGDAIDVGHSLYDLQQGRIGLGLASLGMIALPNIIEKPLKTSIKGVKKLFKNKSDKSFNGYWNQLQDIQQLKAPTVRVISEPSVEITKPIFKHSLTNYNPERYPFEVSSPLGLTHTISGKDLAKIIEYSDGRLPAPSIAISSWDGIRTGRAPYPVHYDDGRYTFYFRPDYIDDMPHEAYEFDMFTPTYKNAETWAGRSLNPTEVVDTKRQMFNEFGTLLDLQRGYDLKSHKKLTDTNNYRSSQSLQEAVKALKKSPNRDYGEIMPLSFVDLRQAPLIVGEGSENPLVLDFLKRLNTHKITTPELFNIKGLALKNGGRLK